MVPPEAKITLFGFILHAKSMAKRPSLGLVYMQETGALTKSSYRSVKA